MDLFIQNINLKCRNVTAARGSVAVVVPVALPPLLGWHHRCLPLKKLSSDRCCSAASLLVDPYPSRYVVVLWLLVLVEAVLALGRMVFLRSRLLGLVEP